MSSTTSPTTTTEICDVCRQPSTKRCSKCKLAYYCSAEHQKEAWPVHKMHCGNPQRIVRTPRIIPDPIIPPSDDPGSPFGPDAGLAEEHEAVLVSIRTVLKTWVAANERARKKEAEAQKDLMKASETLKALEIPAPYAYTPAPPQPYRRVLLSITKTYFTALITALDPSQRNELGARLSMVPPYGERIPKFDGPRCVSKPFDLNLREYEGLMRSIFHTTIGLVEDKALGWCRELAEVGVMTWEERI